jgi:cardiolipin synthase (CMP-forming)
MWKNFPNFLTIARILLVPFVVWSLLHGDYVLAFVSFVVAGITDGLDGFLARRYGLHTELGAYLDPLADKTLMVAIYVTLAVLQLLPGWLAIIVVTRDVLIVGAVLLSRYVDKPVNIRPVFVSKANTAVQIVFAAGVLASLASGAHSEGFLIGASILVAALTLTSFAVYMQKWLTHMTAESTRTKL